MDFVEWLEKELVSREWSRAMFARKGGISQPQVTRVLNREQAPGEKFLSGTSKALRLPVDTVYRAAGLLPPISEKDEITRRLEYKINRLSKEKKEATERFIDALEPPNRGGGSTRRIEQT